jgi:hypothetical protein
MSGMCFSQADKITIEPKVRSHKIYQKLDVLFWAGQTLMLFISCEVGRRNPQYWLIVVMSKLVAFITLGMPMVLTMDPMHNQ